MRANKNLLAIAAGVIACVVVVWFSASIHGGQKSYHGGQKTYEVQPQITLPEYRTDAARAIDAYERLMERYMDLTERNLIGIGTGFQDVVKRLDSIDGTLMKLSTRMARIEKALGIEQPKSPAEEETSPVKAREESSEPAPKEGCGKSSPSAGG
jgi:hypothetical protein